MTLQIELEADTLAVRDDGRDFDSATAKGDRFGLTIMRERLVAVGGSEPTATQICLAFRRAHKAVYPIIWMGTEILFLYRSHRWV